MVGYAIFQHSQGCISLFAADYSSPPHQVFITVARQMLSEAVRPKTNTVSQMRVCIGCPTRHSTDICHRPMKTRIQYPAYQRLPLSDGRDQYPRCQGSILFRYPGSTYLNQRPSYRFQSHLLDRLILKDSGSSSFHRSAPAVQHLSIVGQSRYSTLSTEKVVSQWSCATVNLCGNVFQMRTCSHDQMQITTNES